MTKKYDFVYGYDSLREGCETLLENRLPSLPVLDSDERLVGLVSARGIIRFQLDNILHKHQEFYLRVSEVMNTDYREMSPSASLNSACERLLSWEQDAVPVVDDNSLIGVLYYRDISQFVSFNWSRQSIDSPS